MDNLKLDKGSIIHANLPSSSGKYQAGGHFAIVLNTKEELEDSDVVEVVGISTNNTLADPDDMIAVPHMLDIKKKCWVICSWLLQIRKDQIDWVKPRKAWGTFLNQVVARVKIVKDRSSQTE